MNKKMMTFQTIAKAHAEGLAKSLEGIVKEVRSGQCDTENIDTLIGAEIARSQARKIYKLLCGNPNELEDKLKNYR